ncbi:DUF655 domain-containing protein [Candidatus Woesearchaeota archaeon]|nr:DUF655 domain-containing protein [Candidatus Woesearchaeota archaeon]
MEHARSREENAIVLDFLPNGYPFDERPSHRKSAIVQALGKEHFTLLELTPKPGVMLQPHEEVYIGEGKREQVSHVLGKLDPERMTQTARSELEYTVKQMVEVHETKYVAFYNKAQPMTMRTHQLELLPGVGKKHMQEILAAREDKPFASFEDIRERVKLLPDPKTLIIKRILNEILGLEKHRLFVS